MKAAYPSVALMVIAALAETLLCCCGRLPNTNVACRLLQDYRLSCARRRRAVSELSKIPTLPVACNASVSVEGITVKSTVPVGVLPRGSQS